MQDTKWDKDFRKEIKKLKELLTTLQGETLVLLPELITDEMNSREQL